MRKTTLSLKKTQYWPPGVSYSFAKSFIFIFFDFQSFILNLNKDFSDPHHKFHGDELPLLFQYFVSFRVKNKMSLLRQIFLNFA